MTQQNTFIRKFGKLAVIITVTDWEDYKELEQYSKEEYPDSMDVCVAERKTEFAYGLVNSVSSKQINFMEEPDGEVLSSTVVVIIDED